MACAGRATDLCARVGGEEFAIALQSTDAEGTRKMAQQIQRSLTRAGISHESSPVGILTISMGYGAIRPTFSDDAEAFYSTVDQALYKAKRAGRNRIEQATPESDSASDDQNSIDALKPNP